MQLAAELEEPRTCECSWGTVVGKKARFTLGHDSRHKAQLLTRYDEGDESVGADLIRRGWRTEADLAGLASVLR